MSITSWLDKNKRDFKVFARPSIIMKLVSWLKWEFIYRQGVGGMPEFVGDTAGVVVPREDAAAMAEQTASSIRVEAPAADGMAVIADCAAYPDWAQWPLRLTPFGALGETLRLASVGAADPLPLLILAAWAALALLVARKAFRWTS